MLVVFAVLALAGELVTRVFLFGSAALSPTLISSFHAVGESGLVQPSTDQEILYELKPNLDTHFKLVPFKTNSRGMRDHERDLEKPSGSFRVAVLGDSLTMGAGVALDEAYHRYLERSLAERWPDVSWDFINFGVGGYQLGQYAGVLERRALGYSPDLVMVGFTPANDYELPPPEYSRFPYQVKARKDGFWTAWSYQLARKSVATVYYRLTRTRIPQWEGEYSPVELAYVHEQFQRIADLAGDAGARAVIVYLAYGVTKVSAAGPIEALAEKTGLAFIDTREAFVGEAPSKFFISPIDGHPNGEAHARFARSILEGLEEHRLLPAVAEAGGAGESN